MTDVLAGRYRRLSRLGAGGMGEVWLAEDTVLGRHVAVKTVLAHVVAGDPHVVERLRREARLAARLDHPHAVTVFDMVVEDGHPHLVMQYVAGATLADGAVRDPVRAAAALQGVADALADAHALGIVHRDIKPANLLVDARGRCLLADFGIARADADGRLTTTNGFIGTPAYLAPEVARGGDAGPPADVYALGATLYCLVEGRAPFDDGSGNALVVLSRVLTEAAPSPVRAGPLTRLITAMLAPAPEARPTATQVAAELGAVASGALTAPPEPADPPTVRVVPPPSPPDNDGDDDGDALESYDTLLRALEHADTVTRGWSGSSDVWESLLVGELARLLAPDDRVDLFVPTVFGLDAPRRAGLPRAALRALPQPRAGATIALADRIVCAWTTNPRTLAHFSVTIDHARVSTVRAATVVDAGRPLHGVELVCDGFVWPLLLSDTCPCPAELQSLLHQLAGRCQGSVRPVWDADEVTGWDVADGRGGWTRNPGWAP